jgi:MshEN domain
MGSLEQVLQAKTRLSAADLKRAAGRRSEMGGRLETALLELGLLRENELAPALASHYGLPIASPEDLADVAETVIALVSKEQAAAYNVVPFAAGPGRVDLGVAAALDIEKADELAFLLGRRVRFFVLNEVRIAQALHRYYRSSQPARLLNLADRMDRGLGPSADLSSDASGHGMEHGILAGTFGAFGASDAGTRRKPPGFGRRVTPLKPREELKTIALSEDERKALFGDKPEPPAPPVPTSDLARLSHELQEAASPTAVGEAFLRYLELFCDRSVLLRPEGELFRGWIGHGTVTERGELRELMTGPGLSAEWHEMVKDTEAAITTLHAGAAASGIGEALAIQVGGNLALIPVRVQKRTVCLAAAAPKRGLEKSDREVLANASLRTGLALQSWILRHKSHSGEPS